MNSNVFGRRFLKLRHIGLSFVGLLVLCIFVSVVAPIVIKGMPSADEWKSVLFVAVLNITPFFLVTLPESLLALFGFSVEGRLNLVFALVFWIVIAAQLAALFLTKRVILFVSVSVLLLLSSAYWNMVAGTIWYSA